MHKEFVLAYISGGALLLGVIAATFIIHTIQLTALTGVGLLGLGAFLVPFGFWGADYAFSTAIGELDQGAQSGKVKGERGKVYVPFMANYTPVEWWNLNWFIVTLGVFSVLFGAYFLGTIVGRLGV
ncbi:MAG: hypothetical protein PXY39_07905 [archaeon]|nr:hypothetical protein [archaeon]